MSRGPGRIEREIEKLMLDKSDDMLTVTDLALAAYRGINQVEKKHRVAVIRAAERVAARNGGWTARRREAPAGELVYYNTLNVRSYTLGKVRADFLSNDVSDDELRLIIDGRTDESQTCHHHLARYRDYMREGQAWWLHVEINKANEEGRAADAATLQARLDQHIRVKFS